MKKIADISILTWALSLCFLIGIVWFGIRQTEDRSVEERKECYQAAKSMLVAEHNLAVNDCWHSEEIYRHSKEGITAQKKMVEKHRRDYEKWISRLKIKESVFSHDSKSIEKWVDEGRYMRQSSPKTYLGMTDLELENEDKKWELFLERDLQDLLNY